MCAACEFWCLELCVFLFECLLYSPRAQLRRGAQRPHYYYYYYYYYHHHHHQSSSSSPCVPCLLSVINFVCWLILVGTFDISGFSAEVDHNFCIRGAPERGNPNQVQFLGIMSSIFYFLSRARLKTTHVGLDSCLLCGQRLRTACSHVWRKHFVHKRTELTG